MILAPVQWTKVRWMDSEQREGRLGQRVDYATGAIEDKPVFSISEDDSKRAIDKANSLHEPSTAALGQAQRAETVAKLAE